MDRPFHIEHAGAFFRDIASGQPEVGTNTKIAGGNRRLVHILHTLIGGVTAALICLECFPCLSQTNVVTFQSLNKEVIAQWNKKEITLYDMRTASVRKLDARETECLVWEDRTSFHKQKYSVIAFTDPIAKKIFVGNVSDFYVETDSGLIGGSIMLGGFLQWNESLIPDLRSNETYSATNVVAHFENEINGETWIKKCFSASIDPAKSVNLTKIFGPAFGSAFSISAQIGRPTLEKIYFDDGYLRLDLKTQDRTTDCTIWLDSKTLKIAKSKSGFPQ